MMMRQDFETIAEVLRETRPSKNGMTETDNQESARLAWEDVRNTFADRLATTNPRFDRSRFIAATEK